MRIPSTLTSLVEQGLIDEVVRPLLSGKEAEVFLVRAGGELRVAKVYKTAQNRTFKNRADYTEGRKVRNSRDQRAIDKRSRHGRSQDEAAWRSTEVDMIYRLRDAGVRVPTPYHFIDGVLIMEMVADAEGSPAPRLAEVSFTREEAIQIFERLIGEVVRMLAAGVVHGDLSDFNVLMSGDGPVIIDFPQSVDAASNLNARRILQRDVDNLKRFLTRFAPDQRPGPYAEELWDLYSNSMLTPETRLTGRHRASERRANTAAVLDLIGDANYDERKRRERQGLGMRGLDGEPRRGVPQTPPAGLDGERRRGFPKPLRPRPRSRSRGRRTRDKARKVRELSNPSSSRGRSSRGRLNSRGRRSTKLKLRELRKLPDRERSKRRNSRRRGRSSTRARLRKHHSRCVLPSLGSTLTTSGATGPSQKAKARKPVDPKRRNSITGSGRRSARRRKHARSSRTTRGPSGATGARGPSGSTGCRSSRAPSARGLRISRATVRVRGRGPDRKAADKAGTRARTGVPQRHRSRVRRVRGRHIRAIKLRGTRASGLNTAKDRARRLTSRVKACARPRGRRLAKMLPKSSSSTPGARLAKTEAPRDPDQSLRIDTGWMLEAPPLGRARAREARTPLGARGVTATLRVTVHGKAPAAGCKHS